MRRPQGLLTIHQPRWPVMLLTLSNPLHLAVVGNPGPKRSIKKGTPMARRKRVSKSHKRRVALKGRWKSRMRKLAYKPPYSFTHAVVRKKAGKRKHVKGHAWTGRKGTVGLFDNLTGKLWGTNPRRRGHRRNPAIVATVKDMLITPVTSLPKSLPALAKGSIVKNVGFAAAGAIVAMVAGNQLQKIAMPLLARIPGVSGAMGKSVVQRVVGAGFALLSGSVVAKFAVKDVAARNAFVTGAAAAALVEAIFPGRLARVMSNIPVVGGFLAPAASPVNGLRGLFGTDDLAAYVEAPSYQGTGAYVEAPSYQGTGAYVEAPSYQGTGGLNGPNDAVAGMGYDGDQLAGNLEGMGSNMASHLDS